MPFFHFRQNNSGGHWAFDDKRGISVNVIIEADDSDDANRRAERIGLYFDGAGDCGCCGERWSEAWSDEWSHFPATYGETEVVPGELYPAEDDPARGFAIKWMEEGVPEGYIHYKDGRVESFWSTTAERKDLDGSFGWGVNFSTSWDQPVVFMVTSNGYDEEGNRRAAGKDDHSILNKWEKPTKPTVDVQHEYGYLLAWFPTEQEAQEFADFLLTAHCTIIDETNRMLNDFDAKGLEKQALSMWRK